MVGESEKAEIFTEDSPRRRLSAKCKTGVLGAKPATKLGIEISENESFVGYNSETARARKLKFSMPTATD